MREHGAKLAARWRGAPGWLRSAVVAVVLTAVLFPEIVVGGGSLSLISRSGVVDPSRPVEAVALRPNPEHRTVADGIRDGGSQVWQYEATTRLMRHNLRNGEDPFWNPWTASGQRGPEGLVGMPLSPVVLTIAALGATTTAFTVTHLALVAFGLYCLQQFVVRILGMRRIAAVAACLVFVLNGWMTGTLGGLTAVPYLLFPVVLYARTASQAFGGPRRFVAASFAYASLLLSTFFPGVVLVLVVVAVVAFLLDGRGRSSTGSRRQRAATWARSAPRRLATQAVHPAIGALLAAVVLVPIAWALVHAGPDMEAYSERSYPPSDVVEFLSVLTPRHAYTTFDRATWPEAVAPASWVAYFGIAPLLLLVSAWRPSAGRERRLLAACASMVAVSIGMHLGLPGFAQVWHLPLLRTISPAYFASLAAMGLTVGVGVAVGVGVRRGWDLRGALVGGGLVVAAATVVILLNDPGTRSLVALGLVVAVVAAVVALVSRHRYRASGAAPTGDVAATRTGPWRRGGLVVTALLVAVVGLELVGYQNPTRSGTGEITRDLPDYVGFLRSELGDQRILNVGRGGIVPEWGAALRIRQAGTHTHVQIPEYTRFFTHRIEGTEGINRFLVVANRPKGRWRAQDDALDLLGVRYLVVDTRNETATEGIAADGYPVAFPADHSRIEVRENTDAWPRARVASRIMRSTPGGVPAARDDGPWDPTHVFTSDPQLLAAALEAGVAKGYVGYDREGDRSPTAAGEATIVEEHNAQVRIEVEAEQPSVLVLADAHHDDWQATVDGEPVRVALVDEAFRGVVVPAGRSQVVFTYRPVARDVGGVVSALTLAALAGGCLVWELRRRSSGLSARPARARGAGSPRP